METTEKDITAVSVLVAHSGDSDYEQGAVTVNCALNAMNEFGKIKSDEVAEHLKNVLTEISPAWNFDLRQAPEPIAKAYAYLRAQGHFEISYSK